MKYVLLDIRTEHEMGEFSSMEGPIGEVEKLDREGAQIEHLVVAQYSESEKLIGVIGNATLLGLTSIE